MRRIALALALAAGLSVAACSGGSGGGSGSGAPSGSIVVKLSEYKFDPNKISHGTGSMTFFLENVGTTAHDMTIYDPSGKEVAASDLVQPGNDSTFNVSIGTAGTYPFKCTQPGHADAGMTGTLTIT